MTPVFLLTDGYIANGSEPWKVPDVKSLPPIEVRHPGPMSNGDVFHPYARDERSGASLGAAGHARLDASHRRPGKAGHHGQRQLRAGESPAHGRICGPRRWRTSPRTFRCKPSMARPGEAAGSSWGGTYGAVPRPCARCRPRGARSPCPPALPQPVPGEPGRAVQELREGIDSRIEKRPAAPVDSRRTTWSTPWD